MQIAGAKRGKKNTPTYKAADANGRMICAASGVGSGYQ
ncbi:predicted protein [Sclerotinia sclerotiorum 1980 UF-70]|uniref:Uncharacterized protein n=1 Tax=Sclerotinia sclerotiorum (strain ATCC 18683 / 1980 / Ss-1) TaxID=665079 RepID=A7EGF0_SCLS1|nr:predicted protein [Sclerotinia sclerotiorum 1980 UF-70]EDO01916.1 predicted protein [Sclerotinia sclerotiorum 1980 UF-70]